MERAGSSYYYHSDGLGSIVGITDSSGTPVKSYTYDSFGNIVDEGGSLINTYTYTSRELDSESGLYYYRARYYDPLISRFLQEDPMLDPNLYVYCSNNPVNYIDPLGLVTITMGGSGNFTVTNRDATRGMGVEVEAGQAMHAEDKTIGLYGSIGKSGGVNISAGIHIGIYRNEKISGHMNNISFAVGPATLTFALDKYTNEISGIKVAFGVGLPLSFSASETITKEKIIFRRAEETCKKKK